MCIDCNCIKKGEMRAIARTCVTAQAWAQVVRTQLEWCSTIEGFATPSVPSVQAYVSCHGCMFATSVCHGSTFAIREIEKRITNYWALYSWHGFYVCHSSLPWVYLLPPAFVRSVGVRNDGLGDKKRGVVIHEESRTSLLKKGHTSLSMII